ncbi:hypothetical protein L226DRAFT_608861 [Lentinus tigrinus ALCF2SS1-7]|uniref:Zn(2)-C6 fungal-type domain-containing protein n=1 Tax=Lentinus tigrinus ALCF2SS1-6 TaxID=1328759 RepID=A0A5C2SQ50_9APHY|nr:hypothetical protein L227DRAFT_648746 [Lentinus tigrinus ALCF2SS1-6]RPD79870.1 hypothetical protein L226DRAFT_608861 [Lentinus tigrinus ALCF2SS1-7]
MASGRKAACTPCSRVKLRCEPVPGQDVCERCAKVRLPQEACEKPRPGTRRAKKACASCKIARTRCDRSESEGGPCAKCADEGKDCSLARVDEIGEEVQEAVAGPAILLEADGDSDVQAQGHGDELSTSTGTTAGAESSGLLAPSPPLSDIAMVEADDISSTPNSPTRNWWDVVFAPSPEA